MFGKHVVSRSAVASAWILASMAGGTAFAAPVSWTGLGDGTSWSDPLNWSGNLVPGPADDVTINVAANPTILVSGVNPSIQSLTSAEEIRIASGATFTTPVANCSASVRLAGGTIAGGTWTFSGGSALLIVGIVEGRLNNPAINGDVIHIENSTRLRVNVNTTFTAMRFRGQSQSTAFEPGYVLNSQILIDSPTNASAWIETFASGTFTVGPTGLIATSPGVQSTVAVGQPFWYSTNTALTVQGQISHRGIGTATIDPATLTLSAAGRIENIGTGTTNVGVGITPFTWSNGGTLAVSAGRMNVQDTFTNSGTINITGTGRLTLDDAWSNTGTINLSGTGRLDLDGTFTTAGIGTIVRGGGGTDGTIAVTGAWNNTAAAYTFGAAGSFLVEGGVITGGTINPGAGGQSLLIGNANSALNGVNYTGEIVLNVSSARFRMDAATTVAGVRVRAGNSGVSFAPGYVINFPIVIDATGSIGTVGFDTIGSGTLTFGPSASLSSVGNWTGSVTFGGSWWGSASTEFIAQGTIGLSGPGRTLRIGGVVATVAPAGAVNASGGTTLAMDVSGGAGSNWNCAGTISVADGVFQAFDAWSVTGTVLATNTTCTLEGTYSTASVSRINRTGGQINLQGLCDNTGRTTTLGPTNGSWRLVGGTITGGTIDGTATERLVITGSSGTLDGVTLLDELVLDEGSSTRVRILGATTMPGARLVSTNAGISYASGTVINYPIVSAAPSATTHGIDSTAGGGTLTIGPAGSFTTAPGSQGSLSIGAVWWGAQTATLNNQGLIECGALNKTITIDPSGAFNNSGTVRVRNGADATIRALNGAVAGFELLDPGSSMEFNGTYSLAGTLAVGNGTLARLRGTWSNSGTIAITGGTLELAGSFSLSNLGGFTNAGGTVNIAGTLNNPTQLTLNAATGSWTLVQGGRIVGGTVNQTQGSRLDFSGECTLQDVQLSSELAVVANSARVRLEGTSRATSYRLTGFNAALLFPPGHIINETIVADGASSKGFESWGEGTLTIGPSGFISNTNGPLTIGSFWIGTPGRVLVNQGVIQGSGASATININPPTLGNYDSQTGTLSGGVWRVIQGAQLNFGGSMPIRRNNAVLQFGGNGSTPTDLVGLTDNAGTIELSDGRDMTILNLQANATLFTNSGILRMGPGSRMTVGGSSHGADFTQTAGGSVSFDLGGENVTTDYGSMRIFGTATLDGTAQAQYVNGFVRECGQLFQVVDANSRVGQFATRDVPPITDDSVFLVFYGGADVRMTVSSRADFNEDGFVDFFDYDEFVECFEGNCPPGVSADYNRDDFVDFFDYDEFVFRFEAGCD